MPNLFEDFIISTRPSPKASSRQPPTDHSTTLDSIVKRLLPSGSGEISQYQEALATMNAKFNLEDRLLAQYQDRDSKPRVHAELTTLEYFHATRRPFVDDDRFIGCSKPACYCCYHYISFHPGGFVRPSTHGPRYITWRPPDLVNVADVIEETTQRDVMNKVVA